MNNIEKYYSNTKNAKPNYTVKRFIELKIKPGNAIEIGCGAGRDTVYLIKNGWKVLAKTKIKNNEMQVCILTGFEDEHWITINNETLKTILTKESFKEREYVF